MVKLYAKLWISVIATQILLLGTHANAQMINENERVSSVMLEPLTDVRLVVFSESPIEPLPNVVVRVMNVVLGRTNEDGVLTISLFSGLYHLTFDIDEGDSRTDALRVDGTNVEVLVSVPKDRDTLLIQVEGKAPAVDRGLSVAVEDEKSGVIEGSVRAKENSEPVVGARIFVRGIDVDAKTDSLGRFKIVVPTGKHDLVIVHTEYDTKTIMRLDVTEYKPCVVDVEAEKTTLELAEMVVTTPRIDGSEVEILMERQQSGQVTDIIGAEQFKKSGDSNAASALKRVTGITVVGGKYVYVRGLGERYSSTMLNGLNLPSPDPERRVVPLDMFPSEVLDSMKIQKTYSVDMPGEFGGGIVDLRTKKYASDFVLKFGLGIGATLGSTFILDQMSEDRGKTDWLGIDGGHRELPKNVSDAVKKRPLVRKSAIGDGYTNEELSAFTKSMPNNWEIEGRRIPPDFKIASTVGNSWRMKQASIGFLTSLLYKNGWDNSDLYKAEYANDNGQLVAQNEYRIHDVDNTISLGGMFTGGIDIDKNNSISLNTLVARITNNDFYTYEAYHSDFDARVYNYEWIERMLFSQQIIGNHTIENLHGLNVEWRYAYSKAKRDEPDKRFIQYDYLDQNRSELSASMMANANRRDYIHAVEQVHDIGLDLTLPIKQWAGKTATVKGGGSIILKNRNTDIRRFAYANLSAMSNSVLESPPWEFFAEENEGIDGLRLIDVTQGTDNYTGEVSVFSGYISCELPIGKGFFVSGGIRFEKGTQEVSTFAMFDNDDDRIVRRFENLDVLPAIVGRYDIKKDMLVRIGYGKTLNRPDFKEMSPGCSMSYAGAGDICGAPKTIVNENGTSGTMENIPFTLQPAVIHNVDARYEWYFSKMESISFGIFYKMFKQPIESVFRSSTDKATELRNAQKAFNIGLEIEFKKNFAFLLKPLEDVYVAGNASWIYSRIRMPESNFIIQTNQTRPLQGQSPYVVNGQIGYDNADIGLSSVLLYNVFGKRIATVGVDGLQDIYEQPFHQLDFVAKKRVKKRFEVGLKAKNILNLSSKYTQEDSFSKKRHITRSTKKGRSLSVDITWTY